MSILDHRYAGRGFFRVGDRVRLSAEGLVANLGPKSRYTKAMRGTVQRVVEFGDPPTVASITVLIDGRRTSASFHFSFWEHADKRTAERRRALIRQSLQGTT